MLALLGLFALHALTGSATQPDVPKAFVRLDPGHHTAAVTAVAMLSDGRVVSASADKTVRVWSSTGGLSRTVRYGVGPGPVGAFVCAATNGKRVFAGLSSFTGAQAPLISEDLTSAASSLVSKPAHLNQVDDLAVSLDGKVLVTCRSGSLGSGGGNSSELAFWNAADLAPGPKVEDADSIPQGHNIGSTSLVAMGKTLCAHVIRYRSENIEQDAVAVLYDVATKARRSSPVLQIHGHVRAVGFSGDNLLIAVDNGPKLLSWDCRSDRAEIVGSVSKAIGAISSIGSRTLLGAGDGSIIELSSGKILGTAKAPVTALAVTSRGCVAGLSDGSVVVIDGTTLKTLADGVHAITSLSISGTKLRIGLDQAYGFDFAQMAPCEPPEEIALSNQADGQSLSLGADNDTVSISPSGYAFNLQDSPQLSGSEPPAQIGFLPGSGGSVVIVRRRGNAELFRRGGNVPVPSEEASVTAIGASSDGKWIAAGYADGVARLFLASDILAWKRGTSVLPILTVHEEMIGGQVEYAVWNEKTSVFTASPNAKKFVGIESNGSPDEESKFMFATQLDDSLNKPAVLSQAFVGGRAPSGPSAEQLVGQTPNLRVFDWESLTPVDQDDPACAEFTASSAHATITVEHSDNVSAVRVVANNVSKDIGATGENRTKLSVDLQPGDNIVKVEGLGSNGARSDLLVLKITTAEADGGASPLHVLAFGAGIYPKLPADKQLPSCKTDAQAIYDFFNANNQANMPAKGSDSVLVKPEEADSKRLIKELTDLQNRSNAADEVLVFLSGHGSADPSGNFYYLTADADRTNLAATSISGKQLIELLTKIPCRRLLLATDACYSGNLIAGVNQAVQESDKSFSTKSLGELVYSSNIWVLTSSAPWIESFAKSDGSASLFTECLIDQLGVVAKSAKGTGYLDLGVGLRVRNEVDDKCIAAGIQAQEGSVYIPSGSKMAIVQGSGAVSLALRALR